MNAPVPGLIKSRKLEQEWYNKDAVDALVGQNGGGSAAAVDVKVMWAPAVTENRTFDIGNGDLWGKVSPKDWFYTREKAVEWGASYNEYGEITGVDPSRYGDGFVAVTAVRRVEGDGENAVEVWEDVQMALIWFWGSASPEASLSLDDHAPSELYERRLIINGEDTGVKADTQMNRADGSAFLTSDGQWRPVASRYYPHSWINSLPWDRLYVSEGLVKAGNNNQAEFLPPIVGRPLIVPVQFDCDVLFETNEVEMTISSNAHFWINGKRVLDMINDGEVNPGDVMFKAYTIYFMLWHGSANTYYGYTKLDVCGQYTLPDQTHVEDGRDGYSVYTTPTALNTAIGGEKDMVEITPPAGREVQVGDLILSTAMTTNGYLALVKRVEEIVLNNTAVAAAENNQWVSVAYGNGVFVAVATDGTNRVMRSVDNGQTWTAVTAAENNGWRSVAYGNGVFVAVANSGTNRVMRSTDNGATWAAVAATGNNQWRNVAYGNGVFVAVSNDGTNRVMRSVNNGQTWTAVAATENNSWYSVTYGNGTFVAVAGDGTNQVMRSVDNGQTWTAVAAAANNSWYSVTYGNGTFVAVSYDGTNRVMRSVDNGQTWTAVAAAANNQWFGVTYGNGVFVAVASTGANRVMRSTDNGQTWTAVAATENNSWLSVAYSNRVLVAVATSGTYRVMRMNYSGGIVTETLARIEGATSVSTDANNQITTGSDGGLFVAPAQSGGGGSPSITGDIFGYIKDSRDNKVYRTVRMPDGNIWLAQNLEYNLNDTTKAVWYDRSRINYGHYGLLYTFDGALQACIPGWHVATNAEWFNLRVAIIGDGDTLANGNTQVSKSLMSTIGWSNNNNGIDRYGFCVLPGGDTTSVTPPSSNNFYSSIGAYAKFWTSTPYPSAPTTDGYMIRFNPGMNTSNLNTSKDNMFNVRLVKD